MAEILDCYRGPHSRKLWLLAWAEKVNNDHGSRIGYCSRAVLAYRLGVSPSRVSNIAAELVAEGVIRRLGGGVWRNPAVYELLSLAKLPDAAQGHPRANPTDSPQGHPRANPTQGHPRANPTDSPQGSSDEYLQDGPQGHPRTNPQGSPATNSQVHPWGDPNPHYPDKPSIVRTYDPAGTSPQPGPDRTRDRAADRNDRAGQTTEIFSPDDKPGPGYGLCPECGQWLPVKGGGRLVGHHGRTRGSCPGSRGLPVEPVACIRCGNTGVELSAFGGLCRTCRRTRRHPDSR